MKHAVIDVGSNTIRMVIYEITENRLKDIAHERDFAGLITYVEDGILSDAGKERVILTLSKMASVCKKFSCDKIHCFATASLRQVKNIEDTISEIKKKTGIDMVIISGEDEAKYDFYGLMCSIEDSSGIGFDLGGGSCQLFCFKNRELGSFKSLKIGGQVLYKKFVSADLPTKDELHNIYNYVLKELTPLDFLRKSDFSIIYAMGGAARCAAKYYTLSKNLSAELSKFRLSKDLLIELVREIALDKSGKERILKFLPDRLTTLVPGIITIIAILDFCGAKEIEIALHGVREGFVYEKILSDM